MNVIWFGLVFVSIVFSIINNRPDEFTKAIFQAAKDAVEIGIFLIGIISLWLGITKIIEDSGLVQKLTSVFKLLLSRLFKNIPKGHPAITSIALNFIANLLGLGNAATPLGIKAMQELQSLNENKDTITFEMALFLVINTASIQLIPFTVIGILTTYGSQAPTEIVLPTILATFFSCASAIVILHIFKKKFYNG